MSVKVNRFAFADGLRGFAALWVVLFHLSEGHHVQQFKESIPKALVDILFDYGYLGVAIFFVLSGFVMAHTVQPYRTDLNFSFKFIVRRLIRLSPPYYAAILFAILFLAIKNEVTQANVELPSVSNFCAFILLARLF